ncbi:MAG: hypothetical protein Q8M02_11830 [Candidatus Didemnitutus sp.]|nr:hypothetical protein [Candidatus Didemnitutus sp.]
MSYLGINRESGAIYVGESTTFGYRCPTAPYLTPFRLANSAEGEALVLNYPRRIFREVYFDPVTRVRRGDVFASDGSQSARWYVQDPYRKDLGNASTVGESRYETEMISYQNDPLIGLAKELGNARAPRVLLGSGEHTTYWRILGIEAAANGKPVLTLKAEQYYGEVPDLQPERVPPAILPHLEKLLDDLGASVHRLSPVAIVDRCRDTLALIFGEAGNKPSADLAVAINAWLVAVDEKENIRSNCGRIVARLHSRGKPNEQRSRNLRPLTESDAKLALRCLWTVLEEFEWAK